MEAVPLPALKEILNRDDAPKEVKNLPPNAVGWIINRAKEETETEADGESDDKDKDTPTRSI